MSNNLFYHSLLSILNQQRQIGHYGDGNSIGVSFIDLKKKFNLNEGEILNKSSKLFLEDEIGYHNAHNIVGLCLTTKGEVAFVEKKYKKEFQKSIISIIKDIVQIAIPVLALILSFVIFLESKNKIQEIETRMNIIEKKIKQ